MRVFVPVFSVLSALTTVVAALPASAAEAPETPAAIAARVQKAFDAAADFSAEFRHTHMAAAHKGKAHSEKGVVYIKKPGLMRWDYSEPTVKNFIVDGQRLWFYKPEEAQVIVNDKFKQADISGGLSFLWTSKKLSDEFTIEHWKGPDPQGAEVPQAAIKLSPKQQDPNVKNVVFYVGADGFINKAMVKDHLGNLNVLELRNVKTNLGLKKEAFLYVPGDGVKVIHVD